jgi:hypothetical protein
MLSSFSTYFRGPNGLLFFAMLNLQALARQIVAASRSPTQKIFSAAPLASFNRAR